MGTEGIEKKNVNVKKWKFSPDLSSHCRTDKFRSMWNPVLIDPHSWEPRIWRENQRGALIGFSYSEIRFLNKNIVKYLKINAIFRQSIYFFQLFFVLQHYR